MSAVTLRRAVVSCTRCGTEWIVMVSVAAGGPAFQGAIAEAVAGHDGFCAAVTE